ncbi:MAG: hypothetical protein JF615_07720 [Asticcacaulis sp.]|nr:hypothetical protein [Asticcacaulis sp.]
MIDLWRVGFVNRPISDSLTPGRLTGGDMTWLPDPGSFRFIADPFGVRGKDGVTVFVEAYDYRVKRGEIHYYRYDQDNRLIGQGPALVQPFHLSYPYLIDDGGELYMLPEASRSGSLTLYRCTRFPDTWVPAEQLLDLPAIDATVIRHDGLWWMFYALPGPDGRAMRELHIAWAERLSGPWRQHPANPVRTGFETSRPGGNPFVHGGALYLPMQDCVATYGAAINLLRVDLLTPDAFEAQSVARLTADGLLPGYQDGLHTLSGSDGISFIDVKHIKRSWREPLIKLEYKLRRLMHR